MGTSPAYLVVGRAGMDLAPEPAGSGMEEAATFSAALGGSAANIAAGLARLGARVGLLSAVSSDPVGDFCLRELARYGVDASHVVRVGGEARTSLALTEARVENHRTVIYRNGAADLELPVDALKTVAFGNWTSLVITGTALAREPSRDTVFLAMERAAAAGCRLVLDIDYRPYSWSSAADAAATLTRAADACRIVIGNEEEFAFLAGSGVQPADAARRLGSREGALSIYKMGGQGSRTFSGGQAFATGVYPTRALKPTGAGDSFLAAFLVHLDRGSSLPEAVMAGSAAAAIVVSRPGCAPAMPTAAELADFMKRNEPA